MTVKDEREKVIEIKHRLSIEQAPGQTIQCYAGRFHQGTIHVTPHCPYMTALSYQSATPKKPKAVMLGTFERLRLRF